MSKQTTIITDTIFGPMKVWAGDEIVGWSLRTQGEYTLGEVKVAWNLIARRQNPVVYDIGANVGFHTRGFQRYAEQVVAVEAHPMHYQLLLENTRHFRNVEAINVALGEECKTVKLQEFDPEAQGNYGAVGLIAEETPSSPFLSVPMVTMDSLLEKYPAPDYIKIDVEGNEHFVIAGAKNILANHEPVFCLEWNEPSYKMYYQLLRDLGYHLYMFGVPVFNPANYKRHEKNYFGMTAMANVLALPPSMQQMADFPTCESEDDTPYTVEKRAKEQNIGMLVSLE